MKRHAIFAAALALVPAPSAAQSHDVRLHVNPKWKDCAFQLDPSLTQSAWRRFTGEAGLVAYFRPLTDARPMGRGSFDVSLLQYETAIDDASSAWNDTFVHPDSTHWLFEGSGLTFPGVTARVGVTNKLDVGAYFARNPNSNYGFAGGQAQYNLLHDSASNWAASGRVSAMTLFGPDDFTLHVYGVDLVASRSYRVAPRWLELSPYAGVSAYLSSSHERTAAVSLHDERVMGTQASLGVAARVSRARLAVELNTARVRSTSMKVGIGF